MTFVISLSVRDDRKVYRCRYARPERDKFQVKLDEWSQKNKISISFDLIESFTDHDGNPVFQSAIKLLGEQIGIGIGYSKKESQQAASKMAVKRLRTDKELQQRISATKKKKTGELTDEKEFSDLPEEETV